MVSNKFILETYIERALGSYPSRASFHSGHIMFRCNVCGDSDHNSRKRRGYILKRNPNGNGEWIYYCHNDDCDANQGMLVTTWLKGWFPALYEEFRRENFYSQRRKDVYLDKKIEIIPYDERKDLSYFVPILKGTTSLFENGIEYCKKRKISESIWSKWYIATGGTYQGRLIIPFLDNDNKIYYFQGRSLIGQDPKYLNRKNELKEKEIFNIYHIDKNKPVMVVEGPIDSLFLENSIATLGVKFTDNVKKVISSLDCYFIMDNDKAGKKVSRRFLEEGKYVFNWKKYLRNENIDVYVKDINDLILTMPNKDIFSFADFQKYFTNSAYDMVWFT